jgi:hypothetical protein
MTGAAHHAASGHAVSPRLAHFDLGRRVGTMCNDSFPTSDPPPAWRWDVDPAEASAVLGELARPGPVSESVRDTADCRHGIFGRIVIGTNGSAETTLALRLARQLRAVDGRLLALSVPELHHAGRTGIGS